eukprot:scaffold5227_cov77-Phaeocystis_antarctica.AAC.2
MIAHDRPVQPAAQPRLDARLGLAARLQLVLDLTNEHVHQVLVDHLCSKDGSSSEGRVGPLVARWVASRVSKLNYTVKKLGSTC